jgi:hypothetical protein
VEGGHDDLRRGAFLDWVLAGWNATTVIDHGNATILMNDDRDLLAEAGYSFIYGIIDDLIDEMV